LVFEDENDCTDRAAVLLNYFLIKVHNTFRAEVGMASLFFQFDKTPLKKVREKGLIVRE
jgi:hypothetical protein